MRASGVSRRADPLPLKKQRVIQQPLSDLAVEIIREALTSDKQQYVFASPLGDMPMNRRVMATALRGKAQGQGDNARHRRVARSDGHSGPTICAGRRRPWRAMSGLNGGREMSRSYASKKQEHTVPSVTGKIYNRSKRMKEKRAMLDDVAAELRRIIGQSAATTQV